MSFQEYFLCNRSVSLISAGILQGPIIVCIRLHSCSRGMAAAGIYSGFNPSRMAKFYRYHCNNSNDRFLYFNGMNCFAFCGKSFILQIFLKLTSHPGFFRLGQMRQNQSLDLRRFLCAYYTFRFLTHFVLVYAVYVLMFQIRGMSVPEISVLLAIWCVFVIVFEIPTGALADRWSRKWLIVIGMISKAAGFFVWYFAHSFIMFATGFLLWGLQETLCSGSQEALLYDVLKMDRQEVRYTKVAGRALLLSKAAAALGLLIGGVVASRSLNRTILASVAVMLAAAIPAFFFPDVRSAPAAIHQPGYGSVIRETLSCIRQSRPVFYLLGYVAIALGAAGTIDEYIQLYLKWNGTPLVLFGVFQMLALLGEASGNGIAHRLESRVNNIRKLYGLSLITGFFILAMVTFRAVWGILFYIAVFFLSAVGEVLVESQIQRRAASGMRATLLSAASLVMNSTAMLFLLLFGLLSKMGGFTWGYRGLAAVVILFSSIFLCKSEIKET